MISRSLDIIVSLLGLLVLSPVLLVVAVLVYVKLGSPVFFIQDRPGLYGKPFKLIKFRSMKDSRDKQGNSLPDDERLSVFGARLRASSLDELPELWNVLRGEMSLVGPRPLLLEYVPLYNEKELARHNVKPGITGWAQVKGRNALTWEEKFKFDLWYVKNKSLWLDLKIILLTFSVVFSRRDVSQEGHATMERFKGSE